MRAERELACDALALSRTGPHEKAGYGETILRLLEDSLPCTAWPGLVGILEDKRQIQQRITMIARFQPTRRWSWLALLLMASLALVSLTDAKSAVPASSDISTVQRTEAKRIAVLAEYVQSSALLTNLQSLSGNALNEAVAIAYPDTQLPKLLSDFNQAKQQMARVKPELGPKHPDLLKLEKLKNQIQTQIDNTVMAITNALQFRVEAQKQALEQMAIEIKKAKKTEATTTTVLPRR